MEIKNNYPKIKKQVRKFLKVRKIILLIFLISTVACVIINVSVGGKSWVFYVIGSEALAYYAFLDRSLIDNTFIKKFTIFSFLVCGYLYLIDLIEQSHWSYYVINIISFSVILVQLFFFFVAYKTQSKKIMPMFLTSIASIIFCLLAVTKVVKINWAIIVLGSLGVFVLLILFIFFRKTIFYELKKYFNTK